MRINDKMGVLQKAILIGLVVGMIGCGKNPCQPTEEAKGIVMWQANDCDYFVLGYDIYTDPRYVVMEYVQGPYPQAGGVLEGELVAVGRTTELSGTVVRVETGLIGWELANRLALEACQ